MESIPLFLFCAIVIFTAGLLTPHIAFAILVGIAKARQDDLILKIRQRDLGHTEYIPPQKTRVKWEWWKR